MIIRLVTRSSRIFLALIFLLWLARLPASAMTAEVHGSQLILSGPVVEGDWNTIFQTLEGSSAVHTIILRNSSGGHAETGYAVGELIRSRGLRTAVSGFCNSSCSRMFLGGKERLFTNDPMSRVGFHGHYYISGPRRGRLNSGLVQRLGLKNWIIKHSDGKADPDLVERWINIPVNNGMIYFFHPVLGMKNGASTFFCEHGASRAEIFNCESISRTALDLGIITSLETIPVRSD